MPERIPTEDVLESTRDLDARSVSEILAAIHAQDRLALEAVGHTLPQIECAVEILENTLRGNGRWLYVGAGTSGRMGALDAAELPPTFGFDPERVRAVVAGGSQALGRALEGAEDDAPAAHRELARLALSDRDAVVAISASGRTPFARAGLDAARQAGARRIAVTCDPASPLAQAAEVAITPVVGPEVIAGSTRMKGGLAQKAVLHLLSTTVMIRLGRVRGNLMIHLVPVSEKLRQRAVRIVAQVGGLDEARARELLDACEGDLGRALERVQRGPTPESTS